MAVRPAAAAASTLGCLSSTNMSRFGGSCRCLTAAWYAAAAGFLYPCRHTAQDDKTRLVTSLWVAQHTAVALDKTLELQTQKHTAPHADHSELAVARTQGLRSQAFSFCCTVNASTIRRSILKARGSAIAGHAVNSRGAHQHNHHPSTLHPTCAQPAVQHAHNRHSTRHTTLGGKRAQKPSVQACGFIDSAAIDPLQHLKSRVFIPAPATNTPLVSTRHTGTPQGAPTHTRNTLTAPPNTQPGCLLSLLYHFPFLSPTRPFLSQHDAGLHRKLYPCPCLLVVPCKPCQFVAPS